VTLTLSTETGRKGRDQALPYDKKRMDALRAWARSNNLVNVLEEIVPENYTRQQGYDRASAIDHVFITYGDLSYVRRMEILTGKEGQHANLSDHLAIIMDIDPAIIGVEECKRDPSQQVRQYHSGMHKT